MFAFFLLGSLFPIVLGQSNVCEENTCATNPKRDCSCFEYMMEENPLGFFVNIQPDPNMPEFQVKCTNLDGKLWTLIQERTNTNEEELGPEGFDRTYAEYENGFGNLTGNFWLGLKRINMLTSAVGMSMRLEMFRVTTEDLVYGQYDVFRVDDQFTNYRLVVAGYQGNAAETIESESNGKPFSAKGQDNGGEDCPNRWKGGWWYAEDEISCATCTPNGPYNSGQLGQMACDTEGFGREQPLSIQMSVTPEDYIKNNN